MKIFKILGGILVLVIVAVAAFAAWVQARGIPTYAIPPTPAIRVVATTPTQVDLGEKLVMASCADCHLNRQINSLSGQRLADVDGDLGAVYSANITQDQTHGIGRWTDTEVTTLLRTGIGRDGRYRVIMPHFVYMSDDDIAAVLAFLHSDHAWVRPNPTPSHAQEPSFMLKALANTVMKPTPLIGSQQVAPAPTDAVAYGHYLVVGRYVCYDCHSKDFKTNSYLHPEQSEGYLGGGNPLMNLQHQPVLSRNITPDPETGIGDWTEAQFGQAVRYGMSPHGALSYPMPKYSRLTDEEVHALYSYLRSVPVIKNATAEDKAVVASR